MMQKTAQFNSSRTHRYILTRSWNDGKSPCLFIMLNPSTADENILDPTVTRCLNFAMDWGHGKLVVANVYALRSTDPKGLYWHPDPIGTENDKYILEAAQDVEFLGGTIVCAWGSFPGLGSMFDIRVDAIRNRLLPNFNLTCLKKNKDGSPAHPLYLPKKLTPIPFKE